MVCINVFNQVMPTPYYMLQVIGLHLNQSQSCTLTSVKKIGIHPTKTNAQWNLKQHICVAVQPYFTAAPCTASLSYFNFKNFAQLRDSDSMRITCHLHSCTRACSWRLSTQISNNLTPVCSNCMLVDCCHFKTRMLPVVLGRLSSFRLLCKIKEADKKHPYAPPFTAS